MAAEDARAREVLQSEHRSGPFFATGALLQMGWGEKLSGFGGGEDRQAAGILVQVTSNRLLVPGHQVRRSLRIGLRDDHDGAGGALQNPARFAAQEKAADTFARSAAPATHDDQVG